MQYIFFKNSQKSPVFQALKLVVPLNLYEKAAITSGANQYYNNIYVHELLKPCPLLLAPNPLFLSFILHALENFNMVNFKFSWVL